MSEQCDGPDVPVPRDYCPLSYYQKRRLDELRVSSSKDEGSVVEPYVRKVTSAGVTYHKPE